MALSAFVRTRCTTRRTHELAANETESFRSLLSLFFYESSDLYWKHSSKLFRLAFSLLFFFSFSKGSPLAANQRFPARCSHFTLSSSSNRRGPSCLWATTTTTLGQDGDPWLRGLCECHIDYRHRFPSPAAPILHARPFHVFATRGTWLGPSDVCFVRYVRNRAIGVTGDGLCFRDDRSSVFVAKHTHTGTCVYTQAHTSTHRVTLKHTDETSPTNCFDMHSTAGVIYMATLYTARKRIKFSHEIIIWLRHYFNLTWQTRKSDYFDPILLLNIWSV